MNRFSLQDNVALVAGGRGYLGVRIGNALAEAGALVYSADLPALSAAKRKEGGAEARQDIRQRDVDVTDPESVRTLVDGVVDEAGRLDVLVCSITAKPKDFYVPYTKASLAGWQKVLGVELDGVFLLTQAAGAAMERQGTGGSIVLMSSIYGVVGNDQRIYEGSNLAELYGDVAGGQKQVYSHAAYNVAKGGLISLSRYLAAYWGSSNIRVNCVSAGGVAHEGENAEFVAKYAAKTPLGRKADAEEIASAVAYLASPAAGYVTGHNLLVDGGWTAW